MAQLEEALVAAKLQQMKENGASASDYFVQLDPINVQQGVFTLQLNVDEVYTFSTVSTAKHGSYSAPPAATPFPLPYTENFQGYVEFQEPFNLVPQVGSFEIRGEADCPAKPMAGYRAKSQQRNYLRPSNSKGVHTFSLPEKASVAGNQVLLQTVTERPAYWCVCGENPIAVIGNYSWTSVHAEYYGVLPDVSDAKNGLVADGLMLAAFVSKTGKYSV